MRSISVHEMRVALPKLEELLVKEGEVLITRNGKPVARDRYVWLRSGRAGAS
jgi:antitoxin (DNA-binding transcriptional repressor) of toxin-antitoxin stability system